MGWLLGKKKKVPKVPFPKGELVDDRSLQFPKKFSSEKVIEPADMKAAAGLNRSVPPKPVLVPKKDIPQMQQQVPPPPVKKEELAKNQAVVPEPKVRPQVPIMEYQEDMTGPLYLKKEIYQKILGEIEGVVYELKELDKVNHNLAQSEYNEESYFTKLRKHIKAVHDRLLHADTILFKDR